MSERSRRARVDLTPREQDCLRLVRDARSAAEAAARLGVSLSTVEKHLAAARRKLGVPRTAQAVLLFERAHFGAAKRLPAAEQGAEIPELDGFADRLHASGTLDDAWGVLVAHARRLGATDVASGVVTGPPGRSAGGARMIRSTWPTSLLAMYRAMGGERNDPYLRYLGGTTPVAIMDNLRVVAGFRGDLPAPVLAFGEALLDHGMRYCLWKRGHDAATQAPVATSFVFDPHAIDGLRHRDPRLRNAFGALSAAFWEHVQNARMLHRESGLTLRQCDVLRLAARGNSVAETAEQTGVSMRAVEKILAAARAALGAPTTAAAVYRAMVFRALG